MDDLSYDQFVGLLRSALHYLYDPVQLRRNLLVELLGLIQEFDQAAALQQRLIGAIRALKPAEDESPQSRAWRIYDTLNLQYVRQLPREAVATQLGISERQMRREQRLAIEALAQKLWQLHPHLPAPAVERPGAAMPGDTGHALSAELGWLKSPDAEFQVALGEVLENVCLLAQPLAEQHEVLLELHLPNPLAELAVPQLALRSILLTTLAVAIPHAQPGTVRIEAQRYETALALTITCCSAAAHPASLAEKEIAGLEMARELAAFYHAQLAVDHEAPAGLAVTLFVAAPEQRTLLVVDDNADWMALVQRYLAGTHYLVVGSSAPDQAASLAARLQPATILLDVMMHNVDGWEVLSALRNEPSTTQIPVVICTVLPVEAMALSLGATAFLQKPVAQRQLLELLAQLADISA